jgi:hypothetical protein
MSPARSRGRPNGRRDAEHSPLFHVESPHRGATHEQYHLHHRACGRRDRDLVVLRASLGGSRLAAAGGRPLAFPGSRAGPKQPFHLSRVGCGLSATVIHGRVCQDRWSVFCCVGGPYDPRCVRPANRQADDHQRPETVRVSVSRSDREPLRLPHSTARENSLNGEPFGVRPQTLAPSTLETIPLAKHIVMALPA